MKRLAIIAAALGAAVIAGCGQADTPDAAGQDGAGAAQAEIPAADLAGYKTQCEIAAVGSGATAAEARGLCDCTVTRLAEGRTAAEFDAISADVANQALEQCVVETGLGALPQ